MRYGCNYCNGPSYFAGPDHGAECPRYVKPVRRVRTIRAPKRVDDGCDTCCADGCAVRVPRGTGFYCAPHAATNG